MTDGPRTTTASPAPPGHPGGAATLEPDRRAERRRRVIEAAVGLAAEGGYDAVQMRDVAARSDVALGTIYRYFEGKDHILAVAMIEYTASLEQHIAERPLEGVTEADRVIDVVDRVTAVMREQELASSAALRALFRPDPRVGECCRELLAVMLRIQATAFGEGFDPAVRAQYLRVINRVWCSALLTWVNGWASLDDTTAEVAAAVRVVLRDR